MLPRLRSIVSRVVPSPAKALRRHIHALYGGYFTWRDRIQWPLCPEHEDADGTSNRLRTFFNEHRTGNGIWKWDHYFDIYDRPFPNCPGRELLHVESCIYRGGRRGRGEGYFGASCRIVG